MRICAVVVTFFPTEEVAENIVVLKEQIDHIVIVDNGSGFSGRKILSHFDGDPKVKVVYNSKNVGLAAALNIGVKYARDIGHEWIATFDQDSRATNGMIRTMMKNYERYPGRERVGILAPSCREKATGQLSVYPKQSGDDQNASWVLQLTVITSGSIFDAHIFDAVGYFREELFIDYVDHDFCFRCAEAGYKILVCHNAILDHQRGQQTRHKILWRDVITTNHDAMRRYYIARNSVFIYRKYFLKHPLWIAKDALVFIQNIVKVLLLETDRKSKLINMARGVVDGSIGKLGKF